MLIGKIKDLDWDFYRSYLEKAEQLPAKRIAAFLFFFGGTIGLLWTGMTLSYVVTDVVPAGITQTGHPSAIIFTTDLVFLVSPLLAGAWLLWQRKPAGFIIAAVLSVKGCLYPLVLALGGYLGYRESGIYDPLTPGYLLLGAGCLLCLMILIKDLATSQNLLWN